MIAFISDICLVGGNNAASARIWNYAQSIRLSGEEVYVLSYQDFASGGALIEVEKGIYAYKGEGKRKGGVRRFLHELTTLVNEQLITGILFYPAPNPSFELRFLFWRRRMRFKNVVCEINEVRKFEQTYLKTFSSFKRIVYKLVTSYSEKLSRYYKGIVCISNNIREYFSQYNKNAIVIPILSDIPEKRLERNYGGGHPFRFVFTGSVAIEKENLVELLHGFYDFNKRYTDWEFRLYGSIPQENYVRLQEIIGILDLEEKVRLMGEVDHDEIHIILASADCLILPRRNTKQNYYGFSTKLSEYAVSGTPIILTDTGVVFNYFEDGRDCYKVSGYEAEGFCEQMMKVVTSSPSERRLVGDNAYETAKKYFDWHIYSKLLKDFILNEYCDSNTYH